MQILRWDARDLVCYLNCFRTYHLNPTSISGKSTLALSLLRMVEAAGGRIVYVFPPLGTDVEMTNVYSGSMESTFLPSGWRICGAES